MFRSRGVSAAAVIAVMGLAGAFGATPAGAESVTEEFRIPTEYGSIYGWVERPVVAEGVKVPVLLTYTPYAPLEAPAPGEDGTGVAAEYVPLGYARAMVHLVGTGNSGGCYDYGGIRERRTAYDVVEWLGTRPWTNGRVGMIGISYDGTTPWAAAVEAPPHLTTIVPQVGITRWYDYAFQLGVRLYAGNGTPLLFDFGFDQATVPQTLVDPAAAQAAADNVNPCERVEHNQRGFLPDPVYDAFWDERDYYQRAANVQASVLIEGSWADSNVHPINSIRMWQALPSTVQSRLVMGQQGHDSAQFNQAKALRRAWLDHELLGLDTGLDLLPRVLSDTGSGVLRSQQWPPLGTAELNLGLGTTEGDGVLTMTTAAPASWTDDNPLLSEDDVLGGNAEGSSLLFVGQPLAAATRLVGIPDLHATVTTSEESTFLTPVLFKESSTGQRTVLTRGELNSRNRNGEGVSEAFDPGTRWEGHVRFQPIDTIVPAGHRVGLAVMSMNTSDVLYPDTTQATNELDLAASGLRLLTAPKVEPPPA